MFDCVNGITIDVQSYSAFGTVNIANPIDASKNFVRSEQLQPGGAGDIVVVRLFYQWPMFVTGLGYQHLEFDRQQAAVDRDRRVPERTLLGRPSETPMKPMNRIGFAYGARRSDLSGDPRYRGDRIRHDRAADAGAVFRHGRVLVRRRGRPQGDADGADAVRPDVAEHLGHRRPADQLLQRQHRRS